MRRFMVAVVAVGVVLAAGVSYAQQDGPPAMPQKVRNVLEKFVGTWSWQDEMLTGSSVCRWDPAGNYVICQDEALPWGTSLFVGTLIAWDSVSEDGIVMYSAGPAMHNSSRMKVVSETVMEGQGTGAFFGNQMAATLRWESQGPDRHTLVATHPTDGDEPPYISTMVTTRIKTTSDEQELIKLERELNEAAIARDMEVLERLIADEITISTADGLLITKDQGLSFLESDAFNLTALASEDLKVRVYGNMAVVTGVQRWTEGDGGSGRGRITDTWLKRDGQWQMVAAHDSTIEEADVDIERLSPEMKKLAISVGDWTYEGEQADPPVAGLPFGPAGPFSGTVTTRFVLDGRFVEEKIEDQNPGGTTTVVSMTGYDSKAKHYVGNAFMSDGSRDTSTETVSADGRTWTSQTTTTTKDGKQVLLRSTTRYAPDGDSYTGTTEASPDNGQTWKRWFSEEGKKVTK